MTSRRILVKICGVTRRQDALAAAEAGADAVGFVLWPESRRAVTAERARELGADLRGVLKVGVFVNATRDEILSSVEIAGLDIVQLHGEEGLAAVDSLPVRVWKALRVGPGFDPEAAVAFEGRVFGVLLDSKADTEIGGSGQKFDWSVATALRPRLANLVLAGGLDAANVAEAIERVRPDVVDVSSGVESSPGVKDVERIQSFVRHARSGERRLWSPGE